jgi:type IV fimbrial biogenesis protein FimT
MKYLQSGITLVELMTVISIVVILTALGVPANGWLSSARLSGATTQFVNALAFARSESMRLGTRVTVCKSGDPTASAPSCGNNQVAWASGWLVFVDNTHVAGNTAGTFDGTDTVLKIGEALKGVTLTANTGFRSSVSFLPSGLVRGSGNNVGTGVYSACLTDKKGKSVTISPVGHIQTEQITCP